MKEHKIKSSIYWLIIWDILWVPYEFMSKEDIKEEWWVKIKWWWFWWEPTWAWSDDTSLTLCTIDWLKDWYNIKNIKNKFIKRKNEWLWTSHWYRFDIWTQTRQAINYLEEWKLISEQESNDWNWSLMRILPILFIIKWKTNKEQLKIIKEISSITHPTDTCIYWCFIYLKYAELLLNWLNKKEAYNKLQEEMKLFLPEEIQNIYENIINKDIKNLKKIQTNWYIVSSLEVVFYNFLKYDSFENILIKTVELWWDTDTNWSIVWWLAWLYYWYNTFPKEWIEKIPLKRKINLLLKQFILWMKK